MRMKTYALLTVNILAVCSMGYCVSGAHVEFKDDIEEMENTKQEIDTPRKTKCPVATGSVGVVTYYTQGADKTVAVMFSVPFDYNLYSNWWDVKIYNGMKRATYDMYEDMYYNHPYQGDNGWHTKYANGFQVKGTMTSAGECVMELRITN
ncbi:DELTA-stichotoxin-Hcr4a-like [Pocillopora verrucosa]|uniref:DELTA-stichotoxin-Hcr4a-like n=1 Tax=Pocillopora verrucosa TaxID=203993 RepID=UPI003340DA5C